MTAAVTRPSITAAAEAPGKQGGKWPQQRRRQTASLLHDDPAAWNRLRKAGAKTARLHRLKGVSALSRGKDLDTQPIYGFFFPQTASRSIRPFLPGVPVYAQHTEQRRV